MASKTQVNERRMITEPYSYFARISQKASNTPKSIPEAIGVFKHVHYLYSIGLAETVGLGHCAKRSSKHASFDKNALPQVKK